MNPFGFSALILLFALLASEARGQGDSTGTRVLFEETFDGSELDLENTWLLEGSGSAWVEDDRLILQEDSAGVGIVLWTRVDWPADMELSFDVSFGNNRGIGVFFFAARGSEGEDAFETPTHRTGDYEEYIHGDLDSYSLSLHRYFPDGTHNPGSNVRRNSGFRLLASAMPDPVLEADRAHRVVIRKSGASIQVSVDGMVTHDVTDNEFGAPLGAGKVGFRLRGDDSCRMALDHVRISAVEAR